MTYRPSEKAWGHGESAYEVEDRMEKDIRWETTKAVKRITQNYAQRLTPVIQEESAVVYRQGNYLEIYELLKAKKYEEAKRGI